MSVDSYTTYYETDFETEDELKSRPVTKSRKKNTTYYETNFGTMNGLKSDPVTKSQKKNEAVYGHIPGKKMVSSYFGFQRFPGYRHTMENSVSSVFSLMRRG
jgi:hypothetical protein